MLPILFEFFEIKIYSYPLMIGVSTGVGVTLFDWLLQNHKITTKYKSVFLLGTLFFAWFGAKVFFLIFSSLNNSSQYMFNSNFWLGGGFVFYGGLIVATAFVLFFIFVLKKYHWNEAKYLLPILTISHGVGRIGCFLAGCCYGAETNFFISINHRHPVQLYEAISLLVFGVVFLKYIEKFDTVKSITVYCLFYSVLRFNIEFLRGDIIRGAVLGLSSSQFISVFILLIGLGFLIVNKRKN